MARVLVHAVAATAGGGVTYLRNILHQIQADAAGHQWVVLLPPGEGVAWPQSDQIAYVRAAQTGSGVRRILFDQVELRRLIGRERIDLFLATGNFGMMRPPVPQVLLNRNALYFSREHILELRRRREFRHLLSTVVRRQLAVRSMRASSVNVTPTLAFAEEIQNWVGETELNLRAIPFGFDHSRLTSPVASAEISGVSSRLRTEAGLVRVLMVSHYNYFRNFDTLLAAVGVLKSTLRRPIELILTTHIAEGRREHRYDATRSARLIADLGIGDVVTMLGPVSHEELPALYSLADVVVCPSYAESFGHPMVESMASGRPIVAADRAVHREVCGDAALYFSTFDAEQLAYRIAQVVDDRGLAARLGATGRIRSRQFSWQRHYAGLIDAMEYAFATEPTHVR